VGHRRRHCRLPPRLLAAARDVTRGMENLEGSRRIADWRGCAGPSSGSFARRRGERFHGPSVPDRTAEKYRMTWIG
jgi:hypothetical protein